MVREVWLEADALANKAGQNVSEKDWTSALCQLIDI